MLRRIAILAVVDALLLAALLFASLTDRESAVSVLGPLHGFGFLAEAYVAVRGAGDQRWGWWFPAAIAFTAGPPGALVGHRVISRRLAQAAVVGDGGRSTASAAAGTTS